MTSKTTSDIAGKVALPLICPSALDLAYAPELKTLLLDAFTAGGDIEVHADAVAQADTANLQILTVAARELALRGNTLTVIAPSSAFTRAAERLGLAALLGIPLAQPAE